MLTQEEVRSHLTYNQDTGRFKWARRGKGIRLGRETGRVTKYGYVVIFIRGKEYFAHKLAWLYVYGHYPQHPREVMDHINRDRADNRIANLRVVTPAENNRNMSRYRTSTTPLTGVCWDSERKKWRANLYVDKKAYNLGRYDTLFDAAAARKSAERRYGFAESHGA